LRSDTSVQFVVDVRNTSEIPVFGFTTGLSLVFQTEKRWTFETGIQYSRKGMQSKKADLIWGQPDPSLPTKVSINYRFDYLDIPFKVGYSFAQIGNKLSFFASAGISANIFLKERSAITLEYSDGRTDTQKLTPQLGDPSRLNVAAMVGIGTSFSLGNRLHFRIEPVFRHTITPIADTPVKTYLYSAGVNAGVYFRL
jgi:hypothetical protein